jgi:hypothetical protein
MFPPTRNGFIFLNRSRSWLRMLSCAALLCDLVVAHGQSTAIRAPSPEAAELPHAARAADPIPGQMEYRNWIAQNEKKELIGRNMDGKPAPLKLVVTAVTGDDEASQNSFFSKEAAFGAEVTTDGYVWDFYRDIMGSRGGGGGTRLPASTLARIDELLAELPDDGSRLPPTGRRLLLQAAMGGTTMARVYDRANAPGKLWEILRLGECRVGAYVPEFEPRSRIESRGYENGGFFCLSPDGKRLLFTGLGGPLQFWEPTTHELLAEVPGLGGECIAFSPDGSRAVVGSFSKCDVVDTKTWKATRIRGAARSLQFMPDGRHVLMQTRYSPLEIYDASTWQPVDSLPEVPNDAVMYVPAPNGGRAVVQSKGSRVSLWDSAQHREIAILRDDARISQAVFSPDESLVAVATQSTVEYGFWKGTAIDIWRADSGKKVQELRPFEQGAEANGGVQGLLWSPDGKYLLAGTTAIVPSVVTGVSVFNVATGRHRGQFSASLGINGMALLPDASELVVGCEDGKIRFWDFQEAMKKIKEFEKSL